METWCVVSVICGVAVALEEARVLLCRAPVVQRQGRTWFRPSGVSIAAQDAKLALVLVIVIMAGRLGSTSPGEGGSFHVALLSLVLSALVLLSIRARLRRLTVTDNGVQVKLGFQEEESYRFSEMVRVVRRGVDDPNGPSGRWVYDGAGRPLFELDEFERSDLIRAAIRSQRTCPA